MSFKVYFIQIPRKYPVRRTAHSHIVFTYAPIRLEFPLLDVPKYAIAVRVKYSWSLIMIV